MSVPQQPQKITLELGNLPTEGLVLDLSLIAKVHSGERGRRRESYDPPERNEMLGHASVANRELASVKKAWAVDVLARLSSGGPVTTNEVIIARDFKEQLKREGIWAEA